jgi:hypothetical protein
MKKISILITTVIVLLTAGVVSYAAVPSFQNSVNMNVMKPHEYMLSVESNNAENSDVKNLNDTENVSQNYKIDYAVSPAVAEGLSGTIDVDTYVQGVLAEVCGSFTIGGQSGDTIEFDSIIDSSTMTGYLAVPNLSDMWLKQSIPESEMGNISNENLKNRLTKSNVEELSDRYSQIAFNYFTDVKVDKKAGIIQSKFNLEDLPALTYEIAKTMQNDELIKNILKDAGVWNDFDGYMNTLSEEDFRALFTEYFPIDLSGHIDIKTYVDKNGEITKREFAMDEDYIIFDIKNQTCEVKFNVLQVNFSEGLINVAYVTDSMTISDALTIRYEQTDIEPKTISIPNQNVTEDEYEFQDSIDTDELAFLNDLLYSVNMNY